MGGFGSGRKGGDLPVIEQGLKLDLRSLRRQGLFDPEGICQFISLRWTSSATGETTASAQVSYSTRPDGKWLRLQYAVTRYSDGERVSVDETFRLEAFPQPFGGVRWYVICPDRQVRCQCLYLPPGATANSSVPAGVPFPVAVLLADTAAAFPDLRTWTQHCRHRCSRPGRPTGRRNISKAPGFSSEAAMDAVEDLQQAVCALGTLRGTERGLSRTMGSETRRSVNVKATA